MQSEDNIMSRNVDAMKSLEIDDNKSEEEIDKEIKKTQRSEVFNVIVILIADTFYYFKLTNYC